VKDRPLRRWCLRDHQTGGGQGNGQTTHGNRSGTHRVDDDTASPRR
jgi:hypothetical protein